MSLDPKTWEGHTRGPWKWWTSNSWKRLNLDDSGVRMSVLEPYVCKDGQPDLSIKPADMALIAAAPDLAKRVADLEAELADCWEYFDARADADHDQDGFHGNEEMSRLSAIEELIGRPKP